MTTAWIDFHAHLANTAGSVEALLGLMDELGFAQAVVVPGGAVSPQMLSRNIAGGGERNVSIDNAALLANCARANGRLIPFYYGNPHETPTFYREHGDVYHGLKLGPAVHGVALNDERNRHWVRAAAGHGHPVYLHCLGRGGFDIPDMVLLARAFPEVRFVLGHAGVGNVDFRAVALIEDVANVSFETSGGFTAVLRFAFECLGAERVVFGSEYPMQDPAVEALQARRLGLDPSSLERFTRLNALALLGGGHA